MRPRWKRPALSPSELESISTKLQPEANQGQHRTQRQRNAKHKNECQRHDNLTKILRLGCSVVLLHLGLLFKERELSELNAQIRSLQFLFLDFLLDSPDWQNNVVRRGSDVNQEHDDHLMTEVPPTPIRVVSRARLQPLHRKSDVEERGEGIDKLERERLGPARVVEAVHKLVVLHVDERKRQRFPNFVENLNLQGHGIPRCRESPRMASSLQMSPKHKNTRNTEDSKTDEGESEKK
mmetsp:Transcript_24709/g.54321  ORF Transcript_24709/g.54321 Transcript_24709/m.54321 type:complete len:237 (+) Transcript_24709:633-1343(+)